MPPATTLLVFLTNASKIASPPSVGGAYRKHDAPQRRRMGAEARIVIRL
jgi:hypothetical protein